MFDLKAVQSALQDFGIDGWLLHDFRGSNILARRVLGLENRPVGSRRFFYMIPAQGNPKKLVHRIESAALDHLPGDKIVYLRWQELEAGVASLVSGASSLAMEYSPRNAIPYISRVDAGTVELVSSCGPRLVSSGDLIQRFEASWDADQWAMHLEAEKFTTAAFDLAWSLISDHCSKGGSIRESEVQSAIMDHFHKNGLTTYSPPIVGVGPHSGDPHFETQPGPDDTHIRQGDFVLLDLWAKMDRPRAVYSDLTKVAFVGSEVPHKYQEIFAIVARARDAAIVTATAAYAERRPLQGWELDRAARDVIEKAGHGPAFIHRTGHSIGQEVHGNGANLDDLETHDERLILPNTCFSVEPGIYYDEFGIRSEINVFIDADGKVHVTGGLQQEVVPLLA